MLKQTVCETTGRGSNIEAVPGVRIDVELAERCFEYLDAPVRRIGALDTFVGYSPVLEDTILPQVSTVAEALRELKRY